MLFALVNSRSLTILPAFQSDPDTALEVEASLMAKPAPMMASAMILNMINFFMSFYRYASCFGEW